MNERSVRSRIRGIVSIALALPLVACAAGGGPGGTASTPTSSPAPATVLTTPTAQIGGDTGASTVQPPTPFPGQDDAEITAFNYFAALGNHQYAQARSYLAPDLQAGTSEADLAAQMEGAEVVGLVVLVPTATRPDRVIYQAIVSARTIPGAPGPWNFGANTRYVELIRTPQGWRLSQVSTEPLGDGR